MSYYADAPSTNVLNELFDQQASLRLQLENMGLKDVVARLKDVADEVKEKFGRRPGPTTLWRLLTAKPFDQSTD
jgi:hypothetical protein